MGLGIPTSQSRGLGPGRDQASPQSCSTRKIQAPSVCSPCSSQGPAGPAPAAHHLSPDSVPAAAVQGRQERVWLLTEEEADAEPLCDPRRPRLSPGLCFREQRPPSPGWPREMWLPATHSRVSAKLCAGGHGPREKRRVWPDRELRGSQGRPGVLPMATAFLSPIPTRTPPPH